MAVLQHSEIAIFNAPSGSGPVNSGVQPSSISAAGPSPGLEGAAGPKPDLSWLSPRKGPTIGAVQITASVNEQHEFSARVTSNAVESGMGVSDHRILDPVRLTLTAVLTDAPLDLIDFALGTPIGQTQMTETPQQNFEKLLRMHETHAVFTVVTGLRIYENMTFTRLTVNRDRRTGRIIAFTATCEQINFVQTEIVPVEVLAIAQDKTDLGDQSKDTTQKAEEVCSPNAQSLGSHVWDYIKGTPQKQTCRMVVKPAAPK